jgi:hypothetical protein
MIRRPQEDHADLGIDPGGDRTEDLRPTKNALGRCANTAEGDQNHHHTIEELFY